MYDLISIGNIAIDLYFRDKSLTFKDDRFQLALGGKYFTNYFYFSVGGGGANVAIGAQRNDLKTAVLGKIGNNPFKEIILNAFEKAKVSTYLCRLEPEYLNISSILLTDRGERTIVNYETPNQHIIQSERELTRLEKTRSVYFGNLPDVSLMDKIKLLYFFKQRKIITVVNLGVKDCRRPIRVLANLLNKTSVLILNGHEFADLVKKKFESIDFKKDITDLLPLLKERILIVTLDKYGSYAYAQGQVIHEPAPGVKRIVDSTGAGDGYTAAFIAEYLKSFNIQRAMKSGTTYAGEMLLRVGAN